jgi:hypothetical protein
MLLSRVGFVAPACLLLAVALPSLQGCGKSSETPPFNPHVNGSGGEGAGDGAEAGTTGGESGSQPQSGDGGGSGASGDPGGGGGGEEAGAGAGVGAVGGVVGGVGAVGGVVGGAGAGAGAAGNTEPVFYGPFEAAGENCVQAGQICHRLTTIQCAGEVHCCENPGRTFQECYDYMFDGCVNDLYIDEISLDPIVGFDADFACTAFAEYEQKTEQCHTSVVDWGASLNGLRGIIKGTRNPGDSCFPELTPRTSAVDAAALASCSDGANQACLPLAAVFWNCSPLNGEGGRCMTDINCLPDHYCDNPDMSIIGAVCKYRKQIGQPCSVPNECLTLVCKQGQCRADDQQGVFCLQN